MIHYTCDRCHRQIDTDAEVRYSVEVQVDAVFEAGPQQTPDPDADHLLELHEILERLEDEPAAAPPSDCHCHHFDLCCDCYKVYSRNPLARDFPLSIEFSEN